MTIATQTALHLSRRERSDRIDRCDPGEGLGSIVRPYPLTPTISIEVGYIRLRQIRMPNSGKPELARERGLTSDAEILTENLNVS